MASITLIIMSVGLCTRNQAELQGLIHILRPIRRDERTSTSFSRDDSEVRFRHDLMTVLTTLPNGGMLSVVKGSMIRELLS